MKFYLITFLALLSTVSPLAALSTTIFSTESALTFDKPLSFDTTPANRKKKHDLKNQFARLMRTGLVKNMNAKQLAEGADICLQLLDYDQAVLFLTQLVVTSDSISQQIDAKIKLADIYFEQGKLKKAADAYNDFVTIYPGDSRVAYACYKGILSNYYCTLSEDRDQTFTHTTISLCNNYLGHKNQQREYIAEVQTIKTQCHQRLFDSEISIFEFYFKRGKYKAAETRLANIKKSYESLLSIAAPKVIHCQYRIAQAKGDIKIANELLASLHDNYPQYAKNIDAPLKKKIDYLTRF